MAFTAQPAHGVAGQPLGLVEVSLWDVYGEKADGEVTVQLFRNDCWTLVGSTTIQAVEGVASFSNLVMPQVGNEFLLLAWSGTLAAVSEPFDVVSPVTDQPLIHENTHCTKPNSQKDAESLAYVPADDGFWMGDDDAPSIFLVDRQTGKPLSRITSDSILTLFPGASPCDDGDGNPATTCSYVGELEQLFYDVAGDRLYVINTPDDVDDLDPSSRNRPAIFTFRRSSCSGCLQAESWRPLPLGPTYEGVAMIDGVLYLVDGSGLYVYDEARNRLLTVDADGDPLPPVYDAGSPIRGLADDGTYLWILASPDIVIKLQWATRNEVARFRLAPFNIARVKGIEGVNGRLYILEGDPPNPIYQFVER